MSNQTERVKLPAIGGSSLLVIFTVLCLTIFALLGLETGRASCRLTDSAAQSVSSYYIADAQAQDVLAMIRAGDVPQGVLCADDIYYYSCPITDRQALNVSVRVKGEEYEILTWQCVTTAQWQADDSLIVWSGASAD